MREKNATSVSKNKGTLYFVGTNFDQYLFFHDINFLKSKFHKTTNNLIKLSQNKLSQNYIFKDMYNKTTDVTPRLLRNYSYIFSDEIIKELQILEFIS